MSDRYWATRKPNIILVLADAVAREELGSYGSKRDWTPQLDQLAAQGMRFTQAYAGSPENAPARAALLTGRHAGHLNLRGAEEVSLPPNAVTVAEALQPAGYATGAMGVWGLGSPHSAGIPPRQGFDEWLGYLSLEHAKDSYPTQMWRNADLLMLEKNFYGYKGLPASDLITQAATNFVRINKFKPFFLYLACTPLPRPPESTPQGRAAALVRLDAEVGKLMAELRRLNLSNHTAVFFTSTAVRPPRGGNESALAHRTSVTAHNASDLSEASLRVPLIAWWPGKIPSGAVSEQVVALWDFLPTAAELAQAGVPPHTDGISLAPALLGTPQTNQHAFLYWESRGQEGQQAARWGEWKGIRQKPGSPLELYNLNSDPGETNNVAHREPKIAARIEETLQQARSPSTGGRPQAR